MGHKCSSEGIKTGLEEGEVVVVICNSASVCIIGSNGKGMGAGEASLELKGSDSGSIEEVGHSLYVFELIIHGLAT
jgi:hypothetical protein